MNPRWHKLNSYNSKITNPKTPHILNINKFSLNDAGIYYCLTTDDFGDEYKIGFKLTVNDFGEVTFDKLEESSQFNKNPRVQISILDKLALSRSESVKMYCTTGLIFKFKIKN